MKLKKSSDRTLKISPDLALPRNAATSTLVVYGGKGTGKTNFASVLVEEFANASIRFVVVDPMGVLWGLRHHADGKQPGIDVLILGGIHGHLPITPESGELVADLVVDEYGTNVVIDISRRADGSMWTIGERIKFMTAFAKRLYQRQGEKRRPIHLVIDEAARFAPQVIRSGEMEVAKCMGAIAVLVEEGRNVGVGVTLVTQRSARLNKDVAELADCMIAFRTIGPNSMSAVLDWLGEHVEKSRIKAIGAQLRELPIGRALIVSPGWLQYEGVVAMRKRTTFDSSKTPEDGDEVKSPRSNAKPDLDKYRARLAEIVKQAEENDPKELKKRIVKLDHEKRTLAAQLDAARTHNSDTRPAKMTITKEKIVEVEKKVIAAGQLSKIEKLIGRGEVLLERWDNQSANAHASLTNVHTQVDGLFKSLSPLLSGLESAINAYRTQPPTPAPRPTNGATSRMLNGHAKPAPRSSGGDSTSNIGRNKSAPRSTNGDFMHTTASRSSSEDKALHDLPSGEEKILRVLIQYPEGLLGPVISTLTGYKRRTRDTYIERLCKRGFADKLGHGGIIVATQDGRDALPNAEPLPVGDELRDWWMRRLPSGEAKILDVLIDSYPMRVSAEELDERTGFSRRTRDTYLSRLEARQFVNRGRGEYEAVKTLFEGAPS